MFWRCAAAATHNIDQTLSGKVTKKPGGDFGCFVKTRFTHGVWQACIGVATDKGIARQCRPRVCSRYRHPKCCHARRLRSGRRTAAGYRLRHCHATSIDDLAAVVLTLRSTSLFSRAANVTSLSSGVSLNPTVLLLTIMFLDYLFPALPSFDKRP